MNSLPDSLIQHCLMPLLPTRLRWLLICSSRRHRALANYDNAVIAERVATPPWRSARTLMIERGTWNLWPIQPWVLARWKAIERYCPPIPPTPLEPVNLSANQHPMYAIVEGPVQLYDWVFAFHIAEQSLNLTSYSWPVMLAPVGVLKEHFTLERLYRTFGIMVVGGHGMPLLWHATRFLSPSTLSIQEPDWKDVQKSNWATMHFLYPDRHAESFD